MKIIISFFTFLLVNLCFVFSAHAQVSFPLNSSYKYLKGNEATSLVDQWIDVSFDDSVWGQSSAPFRYGDGVGGTELTDMQGNYSTLYLRSHFEATNVDLLEQVSITTDWDDGFVLYINGVEVNRSQAPDVISYDALSSGLHEYGDAQTISMSAEQLGIVEGNNVIAIFTCNTTLAKSSDFYFDMSIAAIPDLPEQQDSIGITYSHQSCFYDDPFDLSISTPVVGANVVYTLDGSNPQTSLTVITAKSPVIINVSRTLKSSLGDIPSVLVRASIQTDGYKPSKPLTRTFISLQDVKEQSHPSGVWPTSNTNGQYLDFDKDADVVNDPVYADRMDSAFLAIPSISIVTDHTNLFDASSGIYVNAEEQGELWEKDCSAELLDHNGLEGFNVNAGLRIRGGYSRKDNYPKHSFRLFFRSDYGASKLEYPLFGDEGVGSFDKIDLRCAQNYSWANSSGEKNTFVREVFARDSQRDVGQPYTRSRYYHLFLNGMYWGLYQSQERSEARYAESYFGDDHTDYDVVKVGGYQDYELEATDGTMDKWLDIYEMCTSTGFVDNGDYFALEGKDANGESLADGEVWVDIDNLIDYMINIFFTGNYDSPVSRFFSNAKPNNMYAITNHTNKSEGFRFFAHDSEHTLFEVDENRVNLADLSSKTMDVTESKYFHTQWLHHKLSENEEYRLRFADRAAQQLNLGGVFDADACLSRFNARAAQIDKAIIAESARWGDGYNDEPFTRDDDWVPAIDYVRNDYFPARGDVVRSQLEEYDLYSSIEAPSVTVDDVIVYDQVLDISAPVTVKLIGSGSGTVYYTTDGIDPRLVGGDLSPSAQASNSFMSIDISESAVVKARSLQGDTWGALKYITFVKTQTDFSALKVTELHYHPLDSIISEGDTIEGKDFEFIEFKNTSYTSAINMSKVCIYTGVECSIDDNVMLPPQGYFVVAARPSKFFNRYGIVADGNFSKSFSNGGEQVVVLAPDSSVIMDFTYSDDEPWPLEADGEGYSLVSQAQNPQLDSDPNDPAYWMVSSGIHGSPGDVDAVSSNIEKNLFITPRLNVQVYPNPTNGVFNVKVNTDLSTAFGVELYTLDGLKVHSGKYNDKIILDMASFNVAYGIFLLMVDVDGVLQTHKIVYVP